VVSRGRLRLEVGGGESDVPVTRLEGVLTVRFSPVPAGWKPEASLALEAIETDATDAPMVSAPATRRQLEGVINVELRRELAKTVLPPWFPTDATVSGEISPEALKP
jgi:hypothetical protein